MSSPPDNTLLVVYGDELWVFCPFCGGKASRELEIDDYVGGNCMFWCSKKCREVFICPTGYHVGEKSDEIEIVRLINGLPPKSSCSTRLTKPKALELAEKRGFDLTHLLEDAEEDTEEDDAPGHKFFLVGMVAVTHLGRSDELDKNGMIGGKGTKPSFVSLDPPALRFSDVPPGLDTSHDGAHLYYKGVCRVCGRKYDSFIWGD